MLKTRTTVVIVVCVLLALVGCASIYKAQLPMDPFTLSRCTVVSVVPRLSDLAYFTYAARCEEGGVLYTLFVPLNRITRYAFLNKGRLLAVYDYQEDTGSYAPFLDMSQSGVEYLTRVLKRMEAGSETPFYDTE